MKTNNSAGKLPRHQMSNLRDPLWYREEAARYRAKAVSVDDSKELRDSYLALSLEYEKLAVI